MYGLSISVIVLVFVKFIIKYSKKIKILSKQRTDFPLCVTQMVKISCDFLWHVQIIAQYRKHIIVIQVDRLQ